MRAKARITGSLMSALAAGLVWAAAGQADPRPLKVFILAGQSNMEGPARVETFDYIGDDPATAPLLKMVRGADGKPTVCQGAWISYLTGADEDNFELTGKLTAGFGWKDDKAKATGHYYRLMMGQVRKVLDDVQRVYPDYDSAQGYELGGLVWLQGFNDMVDGHVYPNQDQPNRFELYSELLAQFIRDVRKDLAASNLPFVIGVMGVGGLKDESVDLAAFRRAMAAPAAMPEFKGTVAAVQTAPFWSEELGAIDEKHEKVGQSGRAGDLQPPIPNNV